MRFVVDFRVSNNEDWNETFQLLDVNGPVDLTSYDLKMTIAAQGLSAIDLVIGDGLAISNAEDGEFSISVSQSVIGQLIVKPYVHDLLMIKDGKIQQLFKGNWILEKGVTS